MKKIFNNKLVMLCIATAFISTGQGVISPLLPIFAKNLNITVSSIGFAVSIFAFARLLFNFPIGIITDKIGRRPLLILGPLINAFGIILTGYSNNLMMLLFARFISGIGHGMYTLAALAYISDISDDSNRARFIGMNQAALLSGVAIGPAIGGILAELYGIRMPFYFIGIIVALASFYSAMRLPETLVKQKENNATNINTKKTPSTKNLIIKLIKSMEFVSIGLVTIAIFLTRQGSRHTIIPLLAVTKLNISTGMIGIIFTVQAIMHLIVLIPASFLADQYGRRKVILPSLIAAGFCLLLYTFSDSLFSFILVSILISLSMALAGPAPAAYVVDISPKEITGIAMSLYRTAGDIGFVIGPPILGLIADKYSLETSLEINSVLLFIVAIIFFIFGNEQFKKST
ncbi:MAG: MFS transporter [Dehalococcoidia bacterium]